MLLSELLALFRWLWVVIGEVTAEEEVTRRLLNRTVLELTKQFVGKVVDDEIASNEAFAKVATALKDYNYFNYESGKDQLGARNAINLLLHRYMAYDKTKTYQAFGDPARLQDSRTATLSALTKSLMETDFEFIHSPLLSDAATDSKAINMLPYIKQFFDTKTNFKQLNELYHKDGKYEPQESVMYIFYMNVRRYMAKADWNGSEKSSFFWPDLTSLPVVEYTHRPLVTDRVMIKPLDKSKDIPPISHSLEDDFNTDLADRLEKSIEDKARRMKPKSGGRQ